MFPRSCLTVLANKIFLPPEKVKKLRKVAEKNGNILDDSGHIQEWIKKSMELTPPPMEISILFKAFLSEF